MPERVPLLCFLDSSDQPETQGCHLSRLLFAGALWSQVLAVLFTTRQRSKMQKLSKLLFISLGLGSFLAVAAMAQTAAPETSSPSTQPQTTSPAQSPPSTQQSPAPPAGTQSSGSESARPSSPQSGNGPSIDQELQLSDDQKQKIAAVVDDENRQIESVRNDNSLNLEQKQQKVLAIRQAGSPKIKAILTPEQLEKLAAIQQRMRQQEGGNASPSQAPPQR